MEFEKNLREMELLKSFDFGSRARPNRLYVLFDGRDDLVLAATSELNSIRYVPDVYNHTRVSALRTPVTAADVEKHQYRFSPKTRELIKIQDDQVTEASKVNRLEKQFVVVAFQRLSFWLERARHFSMPAHPLDPMVLLQIELELSSNPDSPDPLGYCSSYAAAHGVSLEEAHIELKLMVSSMKQNLQKSQELFWRFKKKIIDNPPCSIAELKNLDQQMKADFILTHRL